MKNVTASTRETSRAFTKLLRRVVEEGIEITITSRGKPVAVLVPYSRYKRAAQRENLEALFKLADRHLTHLSLEDTYRASREELEARGEGDG